MKAGRIPQLDGPVPVAGGQDARARAEGQRAHAAGTLRGQRGAGLLLGGEGPQLGGPVAFRGGERGAARAERQGRDRRPGRHGRARLALGGDVPQPDVPVVAAGGQELPVRAERQRPDRGRPAVIVVPASCWVAASHSWTVPSLLAAATVAPSGLNATASTGLRSELIGAPISCWVATSHSRTFPSSPPVARVAPSGLNATQRPPVTARRSGCAVILAWFGQVPDPDGRGAGYLQGLAAAGERQRERRAAPGRGADQAMRGDVPQPDRAVPVAGRQGLAARAVGHRGHHARLGGQDAAHRLGERLEQAVTRLRGRRDPPGGPGEQRGGDRIGGLERRALRGQPLRQRSRCAAGWRCSWPT